LFGPAKVEYNRRARSTQTFARFAFFQKQRTGSDARFLLTKNQKRVTIHRRSNKSLDRSAFSRLLIDDLHLSTLRARPVNSTVMFLPLAFMFLVLPGLSMSAHAVPSNSAPAPNCLDETFGEALNRSAVVFSGRVLHVDLADETQIVRFLVTRRWKGLRTSKVTITNVLHLEGSQDFQSGKSYFVFALLDQGKLYIRGCSWSSKTGTPANELRC
jgi:hypothetical protein